MSGRDWMTAAITTATTTALTSLPIMVFSSASWCGKCVLAVGPQRLDLVRGEVQEAALAAVDVCVRVVVGQQRQVGVTVHVEQHRLDQCGPPGQEQVLGIRPAGARPHPDPAAPAPPPPR